MQLGNPHGSLVEVRILPAGALSIYVVCCIPSPTVFPRLKDPNFITLAEDIESMYRAVIHRSQGNSQDGEDMDSEVP